MKIAADTSVLIGGRITELIADWKKEDAGEIEIIIPNVVVSELEHQANLGMEVGFDGLKELKQLKELEKRLEGKVKILFKGEQPTRDDIRRAKEGGIDELVRKIAEENNALLVTSDSVQAMVSEAKGLQVRYLEPRIKSETQPQIFRFFDNQTMSIHLKENTAVYAKRGHVGEFHLEKIGETTTREQIEKYAKEIIEHTKSSPKGYFEIEQKGATVIQLGEYRIVITRPPFSDGIEITIVKPLVKTKLSDYNLSEKLLNRLESHAEGVFVAGPPGAGKSTFVQALAEFYKSKGHIIKTMEQPRDLQVGDDITQYSPLEGSMEKTSDILLLVRPDYTMYDELRKTSDFKVFADMRLAGVGLVGVTHASKAIDAIQRLVGRVELGVIPHIVDTVLFIEKGKIRKVYELRMVVKIPYGMREADLARPVIEVRDFETGVPEYELYSYGEEVVVIPTKRPDRAYGHARERDAEAHGSRTESTEASISKNKKQFILHCQQYRDQDVRVFSGDGYLFSARANNAGNIKIKRNSENGRILLEVLKSGGKIAVQQ